jgi:hypothetical protein
VLAEQRDTAARAEPPVLADQTDIAAVAAAKTSARVAQLMVAHTQATAQMADSRREFAALLLPAAAALLVPIAAAIDAGAARHWAALEHQTAW